MPQHSRACAESIRQAFLETFPAPDHRRETEKIDNDNLNGKKNPRSRVLTTRHGRCGGQVHPAKAKERVISICVGNEGKNKARQGRDAMHVCVRLYEESIVKLVCVCVHTYDKRPCAASFQLERDSSARGSSHRQTSAGRILDR